MYDSLIFDYERNWKYLLISLIPGFESTPRRASSLPYRKPKKCGGRGLENPNHTVTGSGLQCAQLLLDGPGYSSRLSLLHERRSLAAVNALTHKKNIDSLDIQIPMPGRFTGILLLYIGLIRYGRPY